MTEPQGRKRRAGRKQNPEGARQQVQVSLGERLVGALDARAAETAGDRSSYIRRLFFQDMARSTIEQARLQSPDALLIARYEPAGNTQDPCHTSWMVEGPAGGFILRPLPRAEALRAELSGVMGYKLDRDEGEARLIGAAGADLVLAQAWVRPGVTTPVEFERLGLEAARRIVRAQDLLNPYAQWASA